ncbi:MAG: FAD-binding oxidoreductase [Sulfolobaceae archaeon]|jgi:FAD/FMN-containing dehydrogenase
MDWIDELSKIATVKGGNEKGRVKWLVTVFAKTYNEIVDVIKFANERRLTIYPFCFNTHHIGPSISVDIGLNLCNFNEIIEFSDEDFYVTAQTGVRVDELFNFLKKNGLFLPAYYNGSLGGFLSTNLPTPFSTFYGYPKNLILMAKIVTGDGIIIKSGGKTLKFSSGYKFHKLLSGMLGFLGIYLESTLKVYPLPETIVTIMLDKGINLTSKYRPVSIIYERDQGERFYATFIGFKRAISNIELNGKVEEGFYKIDYSEGDNVISIHTVRGKEVEEINKAYNYMKVIKAVGIIGTGYCRIEVESFDGLNELRRAVNGYVTVERGEFNGDYWGISDKKVLYKLKYALDPNNVLSPELLK